MELSLSMLLQITHILCKTILMQILLLIKHSLFKMLVILQHCTTQIVLYLGNSLVTFLNNSGLLFKIVLLAIGFLTM